MLLPNTRNAWALLNYLWIGNSAINPLLYFAMNANLRRKLKAFVSGQHHGTVKGHGAPSAFFTRVNVKREPPVSLVNATSEVHLSVGSPVALNSLDKRVGEPVPEELVRSPKVVFFT